MVPAARRRGASDRRAHRHPGRARPADQDLAGRARLFLSLRIQHGPDAAGAVRAGRGVRTRSAAAALDRERVGTGPGRVHLRGATRAGGGRHARAVPHRDAADLPAHGLLRDLHVPAGAHELLFERLASASVAGRRDERAQPVHAGARAASRSRRSAATSRRAAAARRRLHARSRRRPSTATGATGRTRSRPTGRPGATTIAA